MSRIVEHDIAAASQAETWPQSIDLRALSVIEPEPPRFIIPDWLPAGYATLLAGHGGVGKSGIALHLACCIALGRDWWGMETQQRRVLYLSCEDRADVLHWRLSRICRHEGISLADLAGRLSVLDLVGRDTVLWQPSPSGAVLTAPYGFLRGQMAGHDVLMVDGISDTFGGNENARTDAKQFVNALVSLIPPDTGAVLLVGHVAKPAASGMASEGYSGSTGWHNSVRARWYLRPETQQTDDGLDERTGDLILELQKSNLGQTDQSMRFRWNSAAHLYAGQVVAGRSKFEQNIRDTKERDSILAALRAVAAEGEHCPAAMQGPRTTHHVLSVRPELSESLKGKVNRRRFWRHIEHLRQIHAITISTYRRNNRHEAEALQVAQAGINSTCADASHMGSENTTQSDASAPCANASHSAGGYRGVRAHTRRSSEPASPPNGEGVEL